MLDRIMLVDFYCYFDCFDLVVYGGLFDVVLDVV